MPNLPEYQIVDPEGRGNGWFCAPNLIPVGSRVSTNAPPGPHFIPLNPEAKARYAAWLDEDYPSADREGKPLFNPDGSPKMWKPHERYRTFEPGAATAPIEMEVLHLGTHADGQKLQTLAEMQTVQATPFARPGPSADRIAPIPLADEDGVSLGEVISVPAPTSTVTRKV